MQEYITIIIILLLLLWRQEQECRLNNKEFPSFVVTKWRSERLLVVDYSNNE